MWKNKATGKLSKCHFHASFYVFWETCPKPKSIRPLSICEHVVAEHVEEENHIVRKCDLQ